MICSLPDMSCSSDGARTQVELKEVQIQQSMQRALAAVAEASPAARREPLSNFERVDHQARQEAEAKLIQARAQRESASILAEASQAQHARGGRKGAV